MQIGGNEAELDTTYGGAPIQTQLVQEPSEERNCDNCKHLLFSITEEPCFSCEGDTDPSGWQPKDDSEEGHCDMCDFLELTTLKEPCKSCFGTNKKPNWKQFWNNRDVKVVLKMMSGNQKNDRR